MSNSPDSGGAVSVAGRNPRLAGIAWMVLGASCIGIVDGIAKYLAPTLNGVQVVWGYCVASLLCLIAVSIARGESPVSLARPRRPWLQLVRGATLVLSLSAQFVSLRYLPLAVATTVALTAPLIMAAQSGPILGEQVDARKWMAVLVGMVGAILVVRPGTAVFQWASLLTLLGAFFFAVFNITTRMLAGIDRPSTTVLYTFVVSTALVSLALPMVWVTPTVSQSWLFALSGVLGLPHTSRLHVLSRSPTPRPSRRSTTCGSCGPSALASWFSAICRTRGLSPAAR